MLLKRTPYVTANRYIFFQDVGALRKSFFLHKLILLTRLGFGFILK